MSGRNQMIGAFGRHETFHPRYGWFRKAYAGVAQEPMAFSADDATVRFGVGKNMVRAIRFWGCAGKVIRSLPVEGSRLIAYEPTSFGDWLFGELGVDPYLEDPGSLWLMHWMMLSPPCYLPVWWHLFYDFSPIEFSEDQAFEFSVSRVRDNWPRVADSSVKKDVACLLRSYGPRELGRSVTLETLDSPLRELNLICPVEGDRSRFQFLVGPKTSLPDPILAFACAAYANQTGEGRTISVHRLMDVGGPGRAFRLTEEALRDGLESFCEDSDNIRLASPLGRLQVSFPVGASDAAIAILEGYYGREARWAVDLNAEFRDQLAMVTS